MKNKNKCPDITKCTYPHCSCMPMMFCKAEGSDEEPQEKIKYKQVMELGFTRKEGGCFDQVFHDHYGFPYFLVNKVLSTSIVETDDYVEKEVIEAEWDIVEHTVRIIRYHDRTGDIHGKMKIRNLDELKSAIKFFGGK